MLLIKVVHVTFAFYIMVVIFRRVFATAVVAAAHLSYGIVIVINQ